MIIIMITIIGAMGIGGGDGVDRIKLNKIK
jgi:hypothetical protein